MGVRDVRLRVSLFWIGTGCVFALAVMYQVMILWFITGCLCVISLHLILNASFSRHSFISHVNLGQASYVAGDQATVHLQIEKISRLPLFWLVIEQTWCNDANGRSSTYRQLLIPLFRRSFTLMYRLHHLKRGRYYAARVSVTIGDVFGLSHKVIQLQSAAQFMVYPRKLPMISRFSSMLHDQSMSNHKFHQPASFHSIRDYTAGDPLNRIHWKSSARSNELKTKESDPGERRDIVLILDNKCQHNGFFEKSVQVTAGVIECALHLGRVIQFSGSNDQRVWIDMPSLQSLEQALMILSTVRADGITDLCTVLQGDHWQQMGGATIICVTANLSEPLLAAIAQLRAQHLPIMLLFVHGHAMLTWHQTHLKKQLQALGCTFYAISHVQLADDEEVISDVS